MTTQLQQTTRKCSSCRRILPTTYYSTSRDGYPQPRCRECRNQLQRKKYAKKISYHYSKRGFNRKEDGGIIMDLVDQNSHIWDLAEKAGWPCKKPCIHPPSRGTGALVVEVNLQDCVEMRLYTGDGSMITYVFSKEHPDMKGAAMKILSDLDLRLEYGERNLAMARKMYFG